MAKKIEVVPSAYTWQEDTIALEIDLRIEDETVGGYHVDLSVDEAKALRKALKISLENRKGE